MALSVGCGQGTPAPTAVPPTVASAPAEISLDVGTRPVDYGSANQARELLGIIEATPSKASYTLTYHTTDDVVVFGADFGRDTLVRTHRQPNDHGQTETWQGFVMDRLRSAASGGSLNDTPQGKSVGQLERF